MQIYIHRNDEDFGPYSREAVIEYVKQGVFQPYDYACYAGMAEWKTLRDLVGLRTTELSAESPLDEMDGAGSQLPGGRATPQHWPGSSTRSSRRSREKRRTVMIALNVVLILIVVTAIYVRRTGGGPLGRRCLAGISHVLRHLADEAAAASGEAPAAVAESTPAQTQTAQPAATAAPVAVTPAIAAAATPATGSAAAAQTSPAAPPTSTALAAGATVAMAASPAPAAAAPTPAAAASSAPGIQPITMNATPGEAASTPGSDSGDDDTASTSTTPPAAPVAATPAPPPAPPKPFDPADIAGNQASWPKSLVLKQAVAFPAVFNGQIVGSVSVPAGSVVKLASIQGEQVIVVFRGGKQTVPWKMTDLEEEVAKMTAPAAAPAGAATATTPAAAATPAVAAATTPAPAAAPGGAATPTDLTSPASFSAPAAPASSDPVQVGTATPSSDDQ